MQNQYRSYLNELLENILSMGNKTEKIIKKTIFIIKNVDYNKAKSSSVDEYEINEIEHRLENDCMRILSLYHPVASDFRIVTGYLKFITDMERIADQCSDICEIVSMGHLNKDDRMVNNIIDMFEMVYGIFKRVIEIIKNPNIIEANEICKFDDKVDFKFSEIVYKICVIISMNKDETELINDYDNVNKKVVPKVIFAAIDFLFIAKYIERISDHCTNIAEWIIFVETGMHPDLN